MVVAVVGGGLGKAKLSTVFIVVAGLFLAVVTDIVVVAFAGATVALFLIVLSVGAVVVLVNIMSGWFWSCSVRGTRSVQ